MDTFKHVYMMTSVAAGSAAFIYTIKTATSGYVLNDRSTIERTFVASLAGLGIGIIYTAIWPIHLIGHIVSQV